MGYDLYVYRLQKKEEEEEKGILLDLLYMPRIRFALNLNLCFSVYSP